MHHRSSLVESFDWLNPFLCLKRSEVRKRRKNRRERERQERREGKAEEKEKGEKRKMKMKMKMKRKIHPNISNKLITEDSDIFAQFFFF